MKKLVFLAAALTLCTALAVAQDTPSSGSQTGAAASSSDQASTANSNAVQGCLTGTSGNYMLTDATGVMYQLTGDESQLSANLNKEVEVTGAAGAKASASASNAPDSSAGNASSGNANAPATGSTGASADASGGATANANAAKTLEVMSIKKVGDSCSSSK